jgi:hypothetical protein
MQPEFMQGVIEAHQDAHAVITGSYSALTTAQLATWSFTYGPLAVGNMIPALYETTSTNLMSALETAVKHLDLSVATNVVQGTHEAIDTVTEV